VTATGAAAFRAPAVWPSAAGSGFLQLSPVTWKYPTAYRYPLLPILHTWAGYRTWRRFRLHVRI